MNALLLAMLLFASPVTSPGAASYERANSLFVAQRFQEALNAVEESLRLDPKLVPALTLKAKLAMSINRFDVARESLKAALAVDPKAQYAQFLYGMEAYLTNEMQLASPRFRKARQLNPNDPRATLYLGLTTESLGDTDEALTLYREAVRLEKLTGKLQADTLLPGVRLYLLLGRLEEAEAWAREALRMAPNLRDAHFEMARVLLKKGSAPEAATEGEAALLLATGTVTDAQVHYLLIRAWQQSGNAEKAEDHARTLRAP